MTKTYLDFISEVALEDANWIYDLYEPKEIVDGEICDSHELSQQNDVPPIARLCRGFAQTAELFAYDAFALAKAHGDILSILRRQLLHAELVLRRQQKNPWWLRLLGFETRRVDWFEISDEDIRTIHQKDASYGGSWKKYEGFSAFFVTIRKWDRIEARLARHGESLVEAFLADDREEGILDDIGDLRRYLILIEAEMRARAEDTDKLAKAIILEADRYRQRTFDRTKSEEPSDYTGTDEWVDNPIQCGDRCPVPHHCRHAERCAQEGEE